MPSDWSHLRNQTTTAQVTFLDAEVNTGITFARIALQATDRNKVSRNLVSARKAYETITTYLAGLPPNTRGLQDIREKVATLQQLLNQLGEEL